MKNAATKTYPAMTAKSSRIRLGARAAVLLIFLLAGQAGFSQSKYVTRFKPLADSLSRVYGIPSSVILGVAVLESGSGTSRNSKLLNNHFGIVGKNNLMKTKGIRSVYKQYPSVYASYLDFCRLLSRRKYYQKLKGNTNHKLWVEAMSKAGYSEVPEDWKNKVLTTIRKNKLAVSS